MRIPSTIIKWSWMLSWLFLLLLSSSSSSFVQAQEPGHYEGDTCENDGQCENGGVCAEPNEHHPDKYCHCAAGFAGIRCHSYCPLTCQNGGYCRYHEMGDEPHRFDQDRDPADYVCQCFGLFEGPLCEISYMNCGDGQRCYNGGVCHARQEVLHGHEDKSETRVKDSFCSCPPGFGGFTCQTVVPLEEQQQAMPAEPKKMDESSPQKGGKAGLFVGLLLALLMVASVAWYFITHYRTSDVDYSAVELADDGRWRNVV